MFDSSITGTRGPWRQILDQVMIGGVDDRIAWRDTKRGKFFPSSCCLELVDSNKSVVFAHGKLLGKGF